MTIVLVWFVMQILAMLTAALASGVHPFTPLEQQVLLWPPSQPVGLWLERVLFAPLFRWDALHYLNLAANGYQAGESAISFYPLYPYLARLFVLTGISPMVSLVLVASLATLGFAFAFEKLARLDLPKDTARWATILTLIFPIAMVLYIPYIEPLSLLLMTLCLFFARKQRWWLAGLFGALAALTKQAAVFLLIPLALELWAEPANRHFAWKTVKNWASLLPIPFIMGAWSIFRGLVLENNRLDFSDLQQSFISILLSSSSDGMVRARAFAWPWQVLGEALTAARNPETSFHVAVNLGGFLFIVLLLVLSWRSLRPSYRYFSLFILASSLFYFSFYECPTPITSLFRHAFHAFPIFLGLPNLVKSKWTRLAFSAVCILLFILLLYGYTVERWIV